MYLLKRDVFEIAIFFKKKNFSIILFALDGNILKSFFLTDFTRAAVIFTLALSGLRYILKLLSHSSSLELLGICILFIPIRIMRRLAFVLFLTRIISAAKTLFLMIFFSARNTLIIIVFL
jgi:hypothetical protein